MKGNRLRTATVTLCLFGQILVASAAWAEEANLGVNVSAAAISALATVIALPVRLLTCVATVVIGGPAYGLTMGTSELIREELAAGTRETCGGKYYTTPPEVKQFVRESQRRR